MNMGVHYQGMVSDMEYKKGDVVRIRPKAGGRAWCRHHIYVHNGTGFVDTYWRDGHPYSYEELEKIADEIFDLKQNLDDFDNMPLARYENDIDHYRKEDCLFIPMGASPERLLIRKGVVPVKDRVIESLQYKVDRMLSKANSLLEKAMEYRRTIAYLKREDNDD